MVNSTYLMDRAGQTTIAVPQLCCERVASDLEQCSAQVEHLEASIDLLLLSLEDQYYRLLRSLRDKETLARDALKGVEVPSDYARGTSGSPRVAEELVLALNRAEQQMVEIYS